MATSCRFLLAQKEEKRPFISLAHHGLNDLITESVVSALRARLQHIFQLLSEISPEGKSVHHVDKRVQEGQIVIFLDFLLYFDDHYMHDKSSPFIRSIKPMNGV